MKCPHLRPCNYTAWRNSFNYHILPLMVCSLTVYSHHYLLLKFCFFYLRAPSSIRVHLKWRQEATIFPDRSLPLNSHALWFNEGNRWFPFSIGTWGSISLESGLSWANALWGRVASSSLCRTLPPALVQLSFYFCGLAEKCAQVCNWSQAPEQSSRILWQPCLSPLYSYAWPIHSF